MLNIHCKIKKIYSIWMIYVHAIWDMSVDFMEKLVLQYSL